MFTNTIGRWGRSATQRPAPQAPAPRKHARNGRQALDGLKHEAPVEPQREPYIPPPFSPEMHEDLERWVERLLNEAADLDNEALRLMNLAEKRREKAAEAERLVWLVRTVPGEPAKPTATEEQASPETSADQEAPPVLAGDLCFGCKRSRDTLPCYSALEGRDVALCARCHPSADEVDDAGADGEEPEPVDVPELPESMTPDVVPAPVSGPAAVPQLVADRARGAYSRYVIGDGDPDTVRLAPVRDGETRTDMPAVNGAVR